jgi:periplasmic protein TonB
MYRMLLGTGLLLCGLFQQEAILRAQEPAFINGDLAVRFEQAPGSFHYAAWCRTATEFSATPPPPRLPWKSTEPGACWYVMGTKMRNDGGKVDGSPLVEGKLVISAHHVRFIPHDSKLAALYVDFHPEETELLHHSGQEFAALGTTKILIGFKFSKICPACAPGTPVPAATNTELLDQEFQLVQDQIKHFDAAYRHFFALASKIRVEVRAQNQPGGSDVPEAMRLYSDLNRQLAEACPEPAKACIRSYAVYQACIADHGGAKCGVEPNCSAACPLSEDQLQSLKARACVQYDQQGASLTPDWTDVMRRKNAGNVPLRPLPTGVLDVQLVSGSNQPAGLGCSVQASYQRASNPGIEVSGAAGSAGAIHAEKPAAVPAAKATTTASATANAVSPPRPGAPQAVSHSSAAPPAPSGVAAAKPSTPAPVKSGAPVSAKTGAATPSASAAKPAPVPADSSSTIASAKAGAAPPSTVAAARPNIASAARPGSVPPEKSGAMASTKPSPNTPAKAGTLSSEKLGVTAPVRADMGPVKPAISSGNSGSVPSAGVKPAVAGGKSSASAETQSAAPTVQTADPAVTSVQKPATTTLKIAPGTAEGMLVKKVPPTYPLEAKVARVQGTVLLNVSISKTGAVTGVDVVSGPDMLQSAAVDAVKQWQFRPFSLLGQPVEFETTVHVVFGTGAPPQRVQAQGHPQ